MTTTALQATNGAGGQVATISDGFTFEQLELIKEQICVGGTNNELKLFLYQARKTGLDPLARQIYAIKRGGKMTIQTSIDGFRLIAHRTGLFAGCDAAAYDEGLSLYQHKTMKPNTFPVLASVTVYRIVQGVRCAFVAEATWDEFYPGDHQGAMWKKMPWTMLAKCAESKALRQAFPAELANIYTADEMAQADNGTHVVDRQTGEVIQGEVISEVQPDPWDVAQKFLRASTSEAAKKIGITAKVAAEQLKAIVLEETGHVSTKDCRPDQLRLIAERIRANPEVLCPIPDTFEAAETVNT